MRKLLIGVVLSLALALAGIIGGSAAASASTTPVAYGTSADGWQVHVKPATINFGEGGTPFVTNLTWKSWGTGSAWGTGKLWIVKPGCTPLYKCPYSSRWTGVYLNTIRLHGTTRYYARMAVELFVSGKARWVVGWFTGGWRFPAVFPYL